VTDRTTVALVARLAPVATRWEAARDLARHLGIGALLVFTKDAEVGVLIPALGFPQTLPDGRRWRAFLARCCDSTEYRAELPYPDVLTLTPAVGLTGDDACVVLLGGAPPEADVAIVRILLPLLAAAFRGERAAQTATAHTTVAQESARQARTLAGALDTARRDLERAMLTRTEFLTSASHDLKNPLAAIKGTAQLLRQRALRADTPETARLIQGLTNIDVSATHMTVLIDDMLDVTRRQMDRPLALERHPVDLVPLITRVVHEFALTTDRHRLQVGAAPTRLEGRWDARRLERMLGNLIGNAIKYSPDGGDITLTVTEEDDELGRWAVITVVDQGLGIPSAEISSVFERYRRASNVIGRIGGTGIGLASVYQTVEGHGGTVVVDSCEGKGSTFVVRLPVARVTDDEFEHLGEIDGSREGRP
jgi:signal transduction histidine kinase